MDSGSGSDERGHLTKRPITTRRGFIAGASLGALSLYGLWVAYGTAPFGIDISDTEQTGSAHDGGHGAGHDPQSAPSGHAGHGAAAGPSPEEFQREAEEFIARHRLPDGSVQPDSGPDAAPGGAMPGHAHESSPHEQMPGHGITETPAHSAAPPQIAGAPLDVYLLAQKWSFDPSVLRLKADNPYRLRMMAIDVSHGASIQLGRASQIIRLRPGIVVDRFVTFTRPGEYLIYCTVYCGPGHDRMSAKLIVA
jgi:cytochrome c oxidase subunit II